PPLLFWASLIFFYGLPLWSLFLLIRDLVNFYFTANSPGVQDSHFYSRFVLSGINLSLDEGGLDPETGQSSKNTISRKQTEKRWLDWVIPERSSDAEYFEEILRETRSVAGAHEESGHFVADYRRGVLNGISPTERHRVALLHVALRLAGSEDRTLLEEAVKME